MSVRDNYIQNILDLQTEIREQRRIERGLNSYGASNSLLYSQPAARNPVKEALEGLLPPHLIPANVGDLTEIQWDMWYQAKFDFGADHTYDSNTRQDQNFRVDGEAAFLVTRIYRDCHADAAFQAPLTLTLRDNQSSRHLNSAGIPIQAIPSKGYFFELEVPFLMYPAATINCELKCWLPGGKTLETEGSSVQTFSFYGARMRVVNPNVILKAMRLAK